MSYTETLKNYKLNPEFKKQLLFNMKRDGVSKASGKLRDEKKSNCFCLLGFICDTLDPTAWKPSNMFSAADDDWTRFKNPKQYEFTQEDFYRIFDESVKPEYLGENCCDIHEIYNVSDSISSLDELTAVVEENM